MANSIIRLAYRRIIDSASTDSWERLVGDSSYQEFQMQVQFYDQKKLYPRFSELIRQVPAAEKLHFLVSAAVVGYLSQLKGRIPGILNNLGQTCLSFRNYRFEIIESDTRDKKLHRVSICFFSEPLHWHGTAGNFLVVSPLETEPGPDGFVTDMIALQPFLSIYSIQPATAS